MCIIVTKEKNAKPLPNNIFSNIWDNNPDGAGILFNDGKTTTLIKGIMDKPTFLEKVKQANKKNCSFVIHTRIATHGSVKPDNTHPFVSKTLGFAHNGTMNVACLPDKTDSETFFLWTIADKTFEWCKENKFLLDMATDGSRCVVFDMATGEILHLCKEDWQTDEKYPGYMFSNKTYSYSGYSSYRCLPSSHNGMGTSYYDDFDFDDYDSTNWWKKYGKPGSENDNLPKDDIYSVTTEFVDVNKKGDYIASQGWVDCYLKTYATRANPTEKERQNLTALINRMENNFLDFKYYDGQLKYSTQAMSVMLSFYKTAKHKSYYNEQEIDQCFKEFIAGIVCETKEDEEFVKELEDTRVNWSR